MPPMRQTAFKTVPSPSSVAVRGVEALFEYNGLVLNDRRQLDQIRIIRVSGLDDADVRDAREVNADREGETAFNAFHGGRTVILQGYVQAGNVDYMRYLWERVKAAFDDISQERNLLVRWRDWNDSFEGDSSTTVMQDYVFDAGSGTLSATGGQLVPSSTALKVIYMPWRQYVDAQNTVRFRSGASITTWEVRPTLKRLDASNYIMASVNNSNLSIQKNDGGSVTSLASTAWTDVANTDYWVRTKIEGNLITATVYTADPETGATAAATITHTLAGGDATKFGTGVVGYGGLRFVPGGTDWRINDLDIRSLNPGDLIVPSCKKVSKVESDEQFTGFVFQKPFLLTLRSSNAALLSREPTSKVGSFASASLTFPGGGVGIAFPVVGGIVFGGAFGTISNLGYARSRPLLRFAGAVSNPAVVNLTNGTRVAIAGSIAAGGWLDIDCDARTIVDNFGINRYDMRGAGTDWIVLEPGDNAFATGADAATGTCTVTWRHSFR